MSNVTWHQERIVRDLAMYSRLKGAEVALEFLVVTKHLQTGSIVDLFRGGSLGRSTNSYGDQNWEENSRREGIFTVLMT
jgi:hypothetical protein